MSATMTPTLGADLLRLVDAIAPGPIRFDPFGFVSGYKAHQIYTALAAKSDEELAAMNLTRTELPGVAMSVVTGRKAA